MPPADKIKYYEQDLAKEIERGNTAAFDQLYRQLYPTLYLLAFKLSGSEDIAKDVVSEVFGQVWEGRSGLTKVLNLNTYLYTSTRNRTFNHVKKIKSSAGESLLGINAIPAEPEADSFLEVLLHAETIRILKEAIDTLPMECRKVMELVLKGHSTNEVAQMLFISASAVSHQKSRAVRLLKEKMLPSLLLSWFLTMYASA